MPVRPLIVGCLIAAGCGGPPANGATTPAAAAPSAEAASAESVVDELCKFHLSHDGGWSEPNLAARARWLTPDLRAVIDGSFARPVPEGEMGPIGADPFTDMQDTPTSFAAEPARAVGDAAEVAVTWTLGTQPTHVTFVMKHCEQSWCVDDLRYPDGRTLRGLLAE